MQTRSYQNQPTQRKLFGIDAAPAKVRQHGLVEAHSFPLVSKGKQGGAHSGSFRVPAVEAWGFPEIELRAGNSWPSLILDLDSQDALQEHYRRTECESWPLGSWLVQRVSNGHTHLVYNLAVPVHRGELAREKPLRELARIAEFYTVALKADRGYTGIMTHNPLSKAHGPGFKTLWLRRDPYSLGELARVIPFGWRKPTIGVTAIGRNCSMFQALRRWAGKPENRENDVLAAAMSINEEIGRLHGRAPMDQSEVAAIARSVHGKRRQWIAKGNYYSPEQKTLWGRERGIKSGASRRKLTADRDRAIVQAVESGRSLRDVGREFGLTGAAVYWILKRLV